MEEQRPRRYRLARLGAGVALALLGVSGCGSSDPANGTVQCALSEPRCPPDYVCVAATNTCWRKGSYDGGLALDGAATLDGASASEAGKPIDGASSVDLQMDTSIVDAPMTDAPAGEVALDSAAPSVDARAVDVADAVKEDASPVSDAPTDAFSSLSCSELSTEYSAALAKARVCTVGSLNACGQSALGGIQCGCNVPISPAQTSAIATLDALRKAWTAKGCTAVCPAIACLLYKSAVCSSDGSTSGSCVGTNLVPITPGPPVSTL